MHHATTGALIAGASYYYQVGGDQGGWSAVISFAALPGLAAPMRYAVYADFGYGTQRTGAHLRYGHTDAYGVARSTSNVPRSGPLRICAHARKVTRTRTQHLNYAT